MSTLKLPLPDDFHVHLRQGDALADYARDISLQFGRILVMPNTVPALSTTESILNYKNAILSAAPNLEPLMTFKIHSGLTSSDLESFKAMGVVAGKYYPAGVTTNSEDGVSDFESIFPVVSMMEKMGFVFSVHAEEPNVFCLDRETAFIPKIKTLAQKFPKLRIVFEHVSTAAAVKAVLEMPSTVAATITAHHLTMTLDDVIGDALRPHHFCKPILKLPSDREAIRKAAFSGNPKFFFGSDSAPHKQEKKECAYGAAGIYSAPVLLPILVREFEKENALDKLPNFIAGYGADFYSIPRTTREIQLVKNSWRVPNAVHGVVPLAAGETLEWSVV